MKTSAITGDSEMAAAVFHPEARLGRAGGSGLRFSNVNGFLAAIGQPRDEVWDEPIWDWTVHVDGRLAQMWTMYVSTDCPAPTTAEVDALAQAVKAAITTEDLMTWSAAIAEHARRGPVDGASRHQGLGRELKMTRSRATIATALMAFPVSTNACAPGAPSSPGNGSSGAGLAFGLGT